MIDTKAILGALAQSDTKQDDDWYLERVIELCREVDRLSQQNAELIKLAEMQQDAMITLRNQLYLATVTREPMPPADPDTTTTMLSET